MPLHRKTLLILAAGLSILPRVSAAQTRAQSDADLREVASYRLTMENVTRAGEVVRSVAAELKKDPRYQEFAKVKAELEALRKKDEPTEAEQARIEELTARVEQLESALDDGSLAKNSDSLSEMAASFKANPVFARGLAKAGMPAREFATLLLAMFQASFAASLQKAGTIKELPKEVNPENVRFVLDHEAELQKLNQELSALGTDK